MLLSLSELGALKGIWHIAAVLCNKCVTVAITNKHFILTPNATPVGFLPQRFPSPLNGIPYNVVRLTQKPNGYLSLWADPPSLSYAHIVHPRNLVYTLELAMWLFFICAYAVAVYADWYAHICMKPHRKICLYWKYMRTCGKPQLHISAYPHETA